MTEAERKLMQKNAEFGYDETERIKADMISNGVHRRFSLDAENAIVRNLLDSLILVVNGDPITDEQREEFAKRIEEYRAYSRYVKWRKEQSKWELSGTSTSVDEETKETLYSELFDIQEWLHLNGTGAEEAQEKIDRQDVIKSILGIGGFE